MTDGPLKNLKLSSCWKRLVEAIQRDASESAECGALASDALVRELLTDEVRALLNDLEGYAHRDQMDLDPISSVAGIFDRHDKTPFNDSLQKKLAVRLNQLPSDAAFDEALEASVKDQMTEARNHLVEECLRARDTGEISRDHCQRAIDKVNASFEAVDLQGICKALRAGNKNAFKDATSKKEGLGEGPTL